MKRFFKDATKPLALLGVALLAACGGKENVREPAELTSIASPTVLSRTAWDASTGGGEFFSTLRPVLETDAVYVAAQDGEVTALNPASGQRIWQVDTQARLITGPSVSGDLVLAGTLDGEVIALKRADGAPLWRAKLGSEVMAPPVSDGQVVVARSVDGRIYGLSAADGTRLWAVDRSVPSLTLRGLSEPLLYGGRLFAGLDNGRLLALNPVNGQTIWEQAIATPSGRNDVDRITDIDAALVANGPYICAVSFGTELACLDGDSGDVQWRRSIKSYSGMVLAGDLLIVTDEAGTVWALEAKTGAAAWKQDALAYRKLSPPAVFGGHVVVGDYEGYLHWLNPRDGALTGRSRAGSDPLRAAMAAGDKLLYVLNTDGKLSAVTVHY